jgi:hypothetical protein
MLFSFLFIVNVIICYISGFCCTISAEIIDEFEIETGIAGASKALETIATAISIYQANHSVSWQIVL